MAIWGLYWGSYPKFCKFRMAQFRFNPLKRTSYWWTDRFILKYCTFCPQLDPVAWRESQGQQGTAGQSRLSPAMAKSTNRIALGAEQPSAIRLPWLRFSVIFLSCKANARVFAAKSGHGPHSLPQALRLHLSAWQTSHNSSMRQSQSGLGTQTATQPKLIPPILSPGQPRP